MKKSELLRALQTEIALHNLSTFMNETDKVVEVGCTHCKKRFGTNAQFVRHISEDVLPPLIGRSQGKRLNAEAVQDGRGFGIGRIPTGAQ